MSDNKMVNSGQSVESRWWQQPGPLLLLALVVNGVALLLSHNYLDGDAHSRTYMALRWLESPFFISRPNDITWVFGPLHCYLNAFILSIWNNPTLSPRLLSWLLTSLTILPFFHAVRYTFGRREAGIATLLFCGYTLFIHPAAISVSEGINLLFFFAAIWGFLWWREDHNIGRLLIAAVLVLLASSLRYESWLLAPFLTLAILLSGQTSGWGMRVRDTAVYGIVGHAFAAMWILSCWNQWGDPLFFMHYSGNLDAPVIAAKLEAGGYLKLIAYNLAFLPGVMLLSFPVTSFIAALVGLWQTLRKRPGQMFILLLLLYIAFHLGVFVFSAQRYPLARFITLPGALLFTFVGPGVVWLRNKLKPGVAKLLLPLLVIASLLNVVTLSFFSHPAEGIKEKLRAISPVTNPPPYFTEAEDYCNQLLETGSTLVVDTRNYNDRLLYLSLYQNKSQVHEFWNSNEQLAAFIRQRQPDYILYSEYPSNNHELFEISGDSAMVAGRLYRSEKQLGIFAFYGKAD